MSVAEVKHFLTLREEVGLGTRAWQNQPDGDSTGAVGRLSFPQPKNSRISTTAPLVGRNPVAPQTPQGMCFLFDGLS